MSQRIRGVLAPVITPFTSDYAPHARRFVRHCMWLLAHGCSGLAVFGTNSEANSMSVAERMMLLDALVEAGVSPSRLMPGTGCSALTDSVALTAHAVKLGCAGVLMLPPFYYKGVSDEGLFRNFSEVIERVGDDRLQLYLYHFPQMSQVAITLGLIERLLTAYPQSVAGIKDSSGDWNNTKAVLDAFAEEGFDVFAGSESFLLANLRHGGVGCITATGNVNPGPIDEVFRNWTAPRADQLQAAINATRQAVQKVPMIAALKAIVARFSGDEGWTTVRPPLVELTPAQAEGLFVDLAALDFDMPDIRD